MSKVLKITCNLVSDGGLTVTQRGIVYNTCQNPDIKDNMVLSTTNQDTFDISLSGLTGGYTYYIRPFAINSQGISYGEEKLITMPIPIVPTVITISGDTTTSKNYITVLSKVTDNGGSDIIDRGVVYTTNGEPTYYDNKINNFGGVGQYNSQIPLTAYTYNQTVYYKSYAINSIGISYSTKSSYKIAESLAITIINSVFLQGETTALVSGTITSNGGATILSKGVCWSSSDINPVSGSTNTITSSDVTNNISETITGLSNQTYYVRTFAVNSQGISYSDSYTYGHNYVPSQIQIHTEIRGVISSYASFPPLFYVISTDPNGLAIPVNTNITCVVEHKNRYGDKVTSTYVIYKDSSSSIQSPLKKYDPGTNDTLTVNMYVSPSFKDNYYYNNRGIIVAELD